MATTPGRVADRGTRVGLGVALALMLLAPVVPLITGWDVRARTHPEGTFRRSTPCGSRTSG